MSPLLPFIVRLLSSLSMICGPEEVTLLFAGDAMQHQSQLDAAKTPSGYDYSECFANVERYISDADYAVVNLETTLGAGNFTGYPCFCSPVSYAEALIDAGFDMLLTANNHTLDRLDKGLERTVRVLDSLNIDHIGTYSDAASRKERIPFVKNIGGFKVGFLNYTYGTNGITLRGNGVVDYIDRDLMRHDIKATRDAGAEIVVAAVHWGVEYNLLPHSTQKSLADFLVDEGVDLVIGGHPHVIQPMEMRQSEATGKNALVVYSLGNFISGMRTNDTRGGAMVKAVLARDDEGKAMVKGADYSLVFTVAGTKGGRNFTLYPAESDSIPAGWKEKCRSFTLSAEKIFNKHNKDVSRRNIQ